MTKGEKDMKKNSAKTRTWLLYVCVVVLLASIGVLVYRFIESTSGGMSGGSGVIVNYDDTDSTEIYDSEYYASIERSYLHHFYHSWAGKQSGSVLRWVMDDLIEHNKMYKDEPIQLIFGNMNCGGNVTCIAEKERGIMDTAYYEISYEYNRGGQVYLVYVNGGSIFSSPAIIPIIMAVLMITVFFFIIRKAKKNHKSIENMIGGNHGLKF